MTNEAPLDGFVVLFFAGLGLTIAGAANLAFRHFGPRRRVILSVVLLVGVSFCSASLAGPLQSTKTSLLVTLVLLPLLVLESRRGQMAAGWLLNALSRTSIAWGTCLAIGLGAIGISVVRFEYADEAALDGSMAELEMLVECSGDVQPSSEWTKTDRGLPVPAYRSIAARPEDVLQRIEAEYLGRIGATSYVIHREPSDERSNCHGWIFTGGRYRIGQEDVETILAHNGYRETSSPKPGDLALYRKNGWIAHTAVVRYVSSNMPILVEGKWGATGVYLHPVDRCPYGKDVTFYRSLRPGHLLSGLVAPH